MVLKVRAAANPSTASGRPISCVCTVHRGAEKEEETGGGWRGFGAFVSVTGVKIGGDI